jgi:hypothetical protein
MTDEETGSLLDGWGLLLKNPQHGRRTAGITELRPDTRVFILPGDQLASIGLVCAGRD